MYTYLCKVILQNWNNNNFPFICIKKIENLIYKNQKAMYVKTWEDTGT